MKKIVFAITGLTLGGAERVLVDIVNELCHTYDITILTIYGNGAFEKEVNKKVSIVHLNEQSRDELSKIKKLKISFSLLCPLTRKKLYKKYIGKKYDVEVAFLEGPVTWLLSEKSKAKKVVWIHNDISAVFGKGFKAKLKEKLNRKMYQKYDDLVFVSKDNLDKFNEFYPLNKQNKHVIYNYIDASVVLKKAENGPAKEIKTDLPSFVQVSRLTDQKAVSRLIDVHKNLMDHDFKHRVYVVGDGPLKDELKQKIKDNNLEETFILLGSKKNPYPYIKKADYFLLASYYEGYPMVLLEAKVLNKRILITDSAAREVLIGYQNSLIVTNDKSGIYEGMKEFITNKNKKDNKKTFQNKEVLEQIKELLGE